MAYYLVRARPRRDRLEELSVRLGQKAFEELRPFGKALSSSLYQARVGENGVACWEEEDYCSPPLREERAAVLDEYFDEIEVEPVRQGEGWKQIYEIPLLFPELSRR